MYIYIYIYLLFFKKMYYLKRYAVLYCVVNYEIASTSSQIYEQIEVIQDVVTPRKSKMNDSTRDKKQKKFWEKESTKGKWI